MKRIELTSEEFKSFLTLFNTSYESIIYYKHDTVYKIFRRAKDPNNEYAKYDETVLENKRKKIVLLNEMNLDQYFLKPQELVYIDGEFRGYTMDFASLDTLGDMMFKKRKDKIKYLKEARQLITKAHDKGITLGDVNPHNFIFKDDFLALGDLDNSTISSYKTDVFNHNISGKYLYYHPLDKDLDIFLFNVMTVSLLTKIAPSYILMTPNYKIKGRKLSCIHNHLLNFTDKNYKNQEILDILDDKTKRLL